MGLSKPLILLLAVCLIGSTARAQGVGSIRGRVLDGDFGAPIADAEVRVLETGAFARSGPQGNYLIADMAPGRYTLLVRKEGYLRLVRPDVLVAVGRLTEIDFLLAGEFVDMEEFVVRDLLASSPGTEAALLRLRLESPALMDSISTELMSRAGASDAGAALRLVAGATVQDGKYAVVRGLPDRYVNSQINRVRLPTADEDKRAVQLDQFPAAVIESIQVSKTFTPDQQGDASGGAVDVRLRGVPEEGIFQISAQTKYNRQVTGRSDFLSYEGGGLNFWGKDNGSRDIQIESLGDNWTGAVGVSAIDAPVDSKWGLTLGGKQDVGGDWRVGGLASLFYERASSFYSGGIDDSLWVEDPGGPLVPEKKQPQGADDFRTALFDITQGRQSVQWGGLGVIGVEKEGQALSLSFLYTHLAEDRATLAEDTRGKEFFFPGYDVNDPSGPGNQPQDLDVAPYIRTETLEYTERTTRTLILSGSHELPLEGPEIDGLVAFGSPEVSWSAAAGWARLYQPDKRQFGTKWWPDSLNPGFPPFVPPFTSPATHFPFKPAANFNLGNLQRIWKEILEENEQYSLDVKFPFEQWGEQRGYVKVGGFKDRLRRDYEEQTFSNFGDSAASYIGDFDDFWSAQFPFEDHFITASNFDIAYQGRQRLRAWYAMMDLPLTSRFNLIGGARFESTRLGIQNFGEENAIWFPPGEFAPQKLIEGVADADYSQDDVLPSIAFQWRPADLWTVRASYSETVARQTFKELSPTIQQEFLGGPIFIGNPDLRMSAIRNWDVRVDYTPFEGSLLSASWFHKQVRDPIEYVQRLVSAFSFTTAVNYPTGRISGLELEARQGLGQLWDPLSGLAVGGNATWIDSRVRLTDEEIDEFASVAVQAPLTEREMTGAPEHLYNLYVTYDLEATRTQFGLFYTITGDTLLAGAGVDKGNFIPSVYAKEYDTLNFSLTQALGKYFRLQFQAKNLTNPAIETIYRSEYIEADTTKTSFTRGIEYSVALVASIRW